MIMEIRRHLAEVRATTVDGAPGVTLHLIKPNVVDDYGSVWDPHCFDKALAVRLPVLCWSHDWSEPLGSGVAYRTSDDGPEVDFVFDDFDAVPTARRAYAQIQPKIDGSPATIQDCSVGFSNTVRRDLTADEMRQWVGGREYIEESTCDETSLVVAGAVPGAKVVSYRSGLLAVRSGGEVMTVDEEAWLEVARKVAAGDLTVAEGQAALALAATGDAPSRDPITTPVAEAVEIDEQLDADEQDQQDPFG